LHYFGFCVDEALAAMQIPFYSQGGIHDIPREIPHRLLKIVRRLFAPEVSESEREG